MIECVLVEIEALAFSIWMEDPSLLELLLCGDDRLSIVAEKDGH